MPKQLLAYIVIKENWFNGIFQVLFIYFRLEVEFLHLFYQKKPTQMQTPKNNKNAYTNKEKTPKIATYVGFQKLRVCLFFNIHLDNEESCKPRIWLEKLQLMYCSLNFINYITLSFLNGWPMLLIVWNNSLILKKKKDILKFFLHFFSWQQTWCMNRYHMYCPFIQRHHLEYYHQLNWPTILPRFYLSAFVTVRSGYMSWTLAANLGIQNFPLEVLFPGTLSITVLHISKIHFDKKIPSMQYI